MSYVPFIDPIHGAATWWYLLLVPLSFGVSVIYRALRKPTLDHYWRSVALMTAQVVLAMAAMALLVGVVVQVAIPLLPAE